MFYDICTWLSYLLHFRIVQFLQKCSRNVCDSFYSNHYALFNWIVNNPSKVNISIAEATRYGELSTLLKKGSFDGFFLRTLQIISKYLFYSRGVFKTQSNT